MCGFAANLACEFFECWTGRSRFLIVFLEAFAGGPLILSYDHHKYSQTLIFQKILPARDVCRASQASRGRSSFRKRTKTSTSLSASVAELALEPLVLLLLQKELAGCYKTIGRLKTYKEHNRCVQHRIEIQFAASHLFRAGVQHS